MDTEAVPKELADKIRDVYLAMGKDPDGQAILANAKYSRFDPSTDATYDPLRSILEAKARMKKEGS